MRAFGSCGVVAVMPVRHQRPWPSVEVTARSLDVTFTPRRC